MRPSFPRIVEESRLRSGGYGSGPGDNFGLFMLKHPRTGRRLKVMVGDMGGWDHVSVSRPNNSMPTWDNMTWVKGLFFSPDECVVQFHPRSADYVDHHPGCLHMWRLQDGEFPTPPPIMVGPGRKQPDVEATQ